MQRDYDYVLKLVLVGPAAAGKTSLLLRFADAHFDDSTLPTIGVDFRFRSLSLQGAFLKLQLWDTAGQQRFHSLAKSYYRNAHAFLLVYDATSEASFLEMRDNWLQFLIDSYPTTPVYCLRNKCDAQNSFIPYSQQQFLAQQRIQSYDVSAKNGHNVERAFCGIALRLMERVAKVQKQTTIMGLQDRVEIPSKKKCCS